MPTVRAERITVKSFAPFGSIVGVPTSTPTSEGTGYRFWADLAHYLINGETEIGICRVYAQNDAPLDGMERHVRTSEILIPIDGPFVLPLLLPERDEGEVKAFHVSVGEAVVIHSCVWHGACLPVGQPQSSYFVIFRRHTPMEDVEKRSITPLHIRTD